MFGIEDPWIYLAYIAAGACLVFAVIFGIRNWNKEYDETPKKSKR